jgi:hypothetical protein
VSPNGNPSDIIGLCPRLPTWNAPGATPTFPPKRRKPFALYVLASFWYVMGWPIQGKRKLIIAEWSCQGDIGQEGLLLPSRVDSDVQGFLGCGKGLVSAEMNGKRTSSAEAVKRQAIYSTAKAVPFVKSLFPIWLSPRQPKRCGTAEASAAPPRKTLRPIACR